MLRILKYRNYNIIISPSSYYFLCSFIVLSQIASSFWLDGAGKQLQLVNLIYCVQVASTY